MGPTASPSLRGRRGGIRLHWLRAALCDALEPLPLGVRHGLLRVPKLAAIGHELGDEGCTLLLLENQEPLRAALRALLVTQHYKYST